MRSPASCSGDATESELLVRFAKEQRYELLLSLWAHARKSKLKRLSQVRRFVLTKRLASRSAKVRPIVSSWLQRWACTRAR